MILYLPLLTPVVDDYDQYVILHLVNLLTGDSDSICCYYPDVTLLLFGVRSISPFVVDTGDHLSVTLPLPVLLMLTTTLRR